MEFSELSNIWKQSDKELSQNTTINEYLLRMVTAQKIRKNLAEIKWTAWFEVAVEVVWIIFLMGFLADHISEFRFAAAGFLLLLITYFTLGLNIYRLVLHHQINADASVIETQRKLEKLHLLEYIDRMSLLVIIPIFSIPFFVVISKYFFGVDLYQIFNGMGEYILYYTLSSFFIAAIIVYLMYLFPNKELQQSIDFIKELNQAA